MKDANNRPETPGSEGDVPESIQRAYAALGDEAPPDLVDQAVLNRAHAAVENQGSRRPWSFGWLHGLTTAAVIVLGVTVLLQLRDQAPGALPPPGVPQADSAEPRQAAPAASSTIGAETENAAGDAPAATRQLLRRAPAAAAAEDALMQAPALEESATPTDALEDSADVADAADSTAVESITARIDAIETPEEALELISALQAAGRSAEAAEALAAFQARWPGYPLPKALQP